MVRKLPAFRRLPSHPRSTGTMSSGDSFGLRLVKRMLSSHTSPRSAFEHACTAISTALKLSLICASATCHSPSARRSDSVASVANFCGKPPASLPSHTK